MKNSRIRSDSTPVFPRAQAARRGGSQAHAALIVVVWTLLWIWMAAGVLVPLSRIAPSGAAQRAASLAVGT